MTGTPTKLHNPLLTVLSHTCLKHICKKTLLGHDTIHWMNTFMVYFESFESVCCQNPSLALTLLFFFNAVPAEIAEQFPH